MRTMINRKLVTVYVTLFAVAMMGCSGELTDSGAPVELVVTNTQDIQQIDLFDTFGCTGGVGTIDMRVIPKSGSAQGDFVAVRVNRYRVSYQRTDGGTAVPRPFVRSIDQIIEVNGSSFLTDFVILEGDALNQSPFASLLPQNGGRDPQTGRPLVKMDVILEVFGETLGGDRVYDVTRFPLDFCYDCGGCV
jgi:hypothetical protein